MPFLGKLGNSVQTIFFLIINDSKSILYQFPFDYDNLDLQLIFLELYEDIQEPDRLLELSGSRPV
jgi:hypothetical protein